MVHVPILFANPPPKSLHRVFFPGKTWFRDIVVEADTYQWWLMAPWILLGLIAVATNRTQYFWIITPYLICWIVGAYARNGVNPEAARYRDSLLPFAVLLFGLGIDRYRTAVGRTYKDFVVLCYAAAVAVGLLFFVCDL